MKVSAALFFFIFGLALFLVASTIYSHTGNYTGLWILFRVIGVGGPLIIAFWSVKMAVSFFKSWQFDVQLREMLQEYAAAQPGRIALNCASAQLASEFWRQHKGLEKDRIYDREKYDYVNKEVRFKKRF